MLSLALYRYSASLGALTLISLSTLFLTACDSGGKARLQGKILELPESCFEAKSRRAYNPGSPPVKFTAFDGRYPSGLPSQFRFPENTFLIDPAGELHHSDPTDPTNEFPGAKLVKFSGAVRMNAEDLADYFRQKLKSTGLGLETDSTSDGIELPIVGHTAGSIDLVSKFDRNRSTLILFVKINRAQDMDGYTLFGGHALVRP